jgi:FHA domain
MAKGSKPVKAAAKAAKGGGPAAKAAKAPAGKAPRKLAPSATAAAPAPQAPALPASDLLGEAERALLGRLVLQTGLSPREVLSRALQSFGVPSAAQPAAASERPRAVPPVAGDRRLLLSVDGKPALAIDREPFVVGSAEGCDLRIQLPLIAARHAQVIVREGRHIFEDLQSPKGSYQHGQRIDVRLLEDGDEIDLGGFLPLRFRFQ